jgi:hypothetical protein
VSTRANGAKALKAINLTTFGIRVRHYGIGSALYTTQLFFKKFAQG